MFPINDKAYQFELIENDSSLFNSEVINATYVIHLEGNGRYENILKQFNQFKTTNKIYILHNKGFKSGLKQKYIDKPPLDLIDAFLTCFKHASNNNYKNVLIFEDDFICDEKLLDKSVTNDISDFVKSKTIQNERWFYYLGVLPFITSTSCDNHRQLFIGQCAHSVIYSNEFIKYALSNIQTDLVECGEWDTFLINCTILYNTKRFMYDKCLCYQPFSETENSKFWGYKLGRIGLFASEIGKNIFKLFKLDTDPKIGFNKAYEICVKMPTLSL
jgi:hypothetical protein